MGDALTPTREAKKKKHSGGIFLRLVGLGVWSGESYNWEKLREQNGNKKKDIGVIWQQKWYCKQMHTVPL